MISDLNLPDLLPFFFYGVDGTAGTRNDLLLSLLYHENSQNSHACAESSDSRSCLAVVRHTCPLFSGVLCMSYKMGALVRRQGIFTLSTSAVMKRFYIHPCPLTIEADTLEEAMEIYVEGIADHVRHGDAEEERAIREGRE